jgi:hypothetical protein
VRESGGREKYKRNRVDLMLYVMFHFFSNKYDFFFDNVIFHVNKDYHHLINHDII